MAEKNPITKIEGLFNQYVDEQTVTAAEYNGNITALKEAIEHNGGILKDVKLIADGKIPVDYIDEKHIADNAVTLNKLAPEVFSGLPYVKPELFGDIVTALHDDSFNYNGILLNGSILSKHIAAKVDVNVSGPVVSRTSCTVTIQKSKTDYETTEVASAQPASDKCYLEDVETYFKDKKISGIEASWDLEYTFETALNLTHFNIEFAIQSYVAATTQWLADSQHGAWPSVGDCNIDSIKFLNSQGKAVGHGVPGSNFITKNNTEHWLASSSYGYETCRLDWSTTIIHNFEDVKKIVVTVSCSNGDVNYNKPLQNYAVKVITPLTFTASGEAFETAETNTTCLVTLPLYPTLANYNVYKLNLKEFEGITPDTDISVEMPLALPDFAGGGAPRYTALKINNKTFTPLINPTKISLELEKPVIISGIPSVPTDGNTERTMFNETHTEIVEPGTRYYWLRPLGAAEGFIYNSTVSEIATQLKEAGVEQLQTHAYNSAVDKTFKIKTNSPDYSIGSFSLVCVEY